jgi:hypothetical protein
LPDAGWKSDNPFLPSFFNLLAQPLCGKVKKILGTDLPKKRQPGLSAGNNPQKQVASTA